MKSIVFNMIKIEGMERNTTVSIGKNHEYDWENSSKTNSGFGKMYGTNFMLNNIDHVYDDDVLDGLIFDLTVK